MKPPAPLPLAALAAALLAAPLALPRAALAAPTAGPPRAEPDIDRPLRWLVAAQSDSGGWGPEAKTEADVATTAISAISLIRLGHTMSAGAYRESTRRAVQFVVAAVEKTPGEAIDINPPGTLPQRKLGRHIDTFLGAQLLAEALETMPQGKERDHVRAALDAVVKKVARAQAADGSFEKDGWAPVLSSAFANEGLYAARHAGASVDGRVLDRSNKHMLESYDVATRSFKTGESAGVQLYQVAGTAQAAARSGQMGGPAARAALDRLSDEGFIRGFGSYGGEEHVSYMMTSAALASVGGKDWTRWNDGIRHRLAAIQRDNGTWRGDHCITSTSFCTAASLITLTIKPGQPKTHA